MLMNPMLKSIMIGDDLVKVDNKYDPDQIPPNFRIASLHRQASAVGKIIPINENFRQQKCPCCLRIVEKEQFSLKTNVLKLSFLGAGVPLFFDFIKQSITILIILFCTSGDYNLITNFAFGTSCQKDIDGKKRTDNCDLNYITQLSLANKRFEPSLMNLQQMLNLVSIFIIIVLLHYFRYQQRIIHRDCDYHAITPADYSVKLSNIPKTKDRGFESAIKRYLEEYLNLHVPYDQRVIQTFENKAENQLLKIPNRVHSISFAYNLEEYQALNKEKEQIIQEKKKLLQSQYAQQSSTLPRQIDLKLERQNRSIDDYFKQFESVEKKKENFVGIAYATFQWESDQEALLALNKTTFWGRYFGRYSQLYWENQNIIVDEAPEPSDIRWVNLHIEKKKKKLNRMLSVLIIIVQLCFSMWAIYNISKLQQHLLHYENFFLKQLASLAPIIIFCINQLLQFSIKYVTSFQRFSTYTHHHISVATSIAIAQFVNSAVVPWLVFTYLLDENYYREGGLVYNQTNFFFQDMIFCVLYNLIDPFYLIKLVQQRLEKIKQDKSVLTQSELNQLFENNEEQLSDRYASILKTMLATSFYASIIPIGILFSTTSLTLLYWVYKYMFTRKRTFKQSISFDLSIRMIQILELMIPIYCFTNFWFEYTFTLGQEVSSYAIIGVVIGIVNAVLPNNEINQALFTVEDSKIFGTDYLKSNPAAVFELQKEVQKMKE